MDMVNDQIGSPTYAADLAQAMLLIVQSPKWIPGIYNYSNEGKISWYDFALAIKLGGYTCEVNGILLRLILRPKRPAFIVDKTKIKTTALLFQIMRRV
jgi:dTDP-4-dehydrorhamnose reductase